MPLCAVPSHFKTATLPRGADYTSLSGLTAGKPPSMPLHVRNPHTTTATLQAMFSAKIDI